MPRCKECKTKFEPKYFNQKFCLDKDECIKAHVVYAKELREKSINKEWKKRQKKMDIEVNIKKHRSYMNDEVQKLSRLIDKKCGVAECIDCKRPLPKKYDSGHFHSKGSNASIAWNLHNMHSQRSECNMPEIGGGRRLEYYEGLIERYGQEYADYVRYDIVMLYPAIHLSNQEVADKVTLVRKLNREIDTYKFTDPIKAREMFNKIIGIYDTPRT